MTVAPKKTTNTNKTTKVNKILKSNKPVMVLFYMNGCSHCDALHPTWKEVKNSYKNNKGIETAEVEFGDLALFPDDIRKNIAGFPTIQIIKGGNVVSEYTGGRTKESIEEFANKFVDDKKSKSNTKLNKTDSVKNILIGGDIKSKSKKNTAK